MTTSLYDGRYLYALDDEPDMSLREAQCAFKASSAETPSAPLTAFSRDLWHARLGHPSSGAVLALAKEAVGISNLERSSICDDCVMGKHQRPPFRRSSTLAPQLLSRVHVDAAGPFRIRAIGGFLYFLTILDDFSRYRVVFLLKSLKHDVILQVLDQYRARMEKHTKRRLLSAELETVRSDNAFLSTLLDLWRGKHGIKGEFSCSGSSASNGRAERDIKSLLMIAVTSGNRATEVDQPWSQPMWLCALVAMRWHLNIL
jgi:transposase InsO family protein